MGRTRQVHRDAEGPVTGKLPRGQQGPGCRSRDAKGGANRHGNGSRRRHVAQGSGTSGGGWWAAGTGNVHVGGASHRERILGAGKKWGGFKEERLQIGRRSERGGKE